MLFIQKIIYICIRMLLIDRIINRKLSVQISAKVVLAIALLLTIALFVMLTFSREAVTKEAHHNAEHTLEYTARQIDNVLLDVEQASGNIYWDLLTHLDNPDRNDEILRGTCSCLSVYCRQYDCFRTGLL